MNEVCAFECTGLHLDGRRLAHSPGTGVPRLLSFARASP